MKISTKSILPNDRLDSMKARKGTAGHAERCGVFHAECGVLVTIVTGERKGNR
jgi:hypothetical protein